MTTCSPRVADLAEDQRPRERLWSLGAEALADAELVAILLGSGRPGQNAIDLARAILIEHGGPAGLARLDAVALARVPGIGVAKATRIVAGLALAGRCGAEYVRPVVAGAADVARLAGPWLLHRRRERVVAVICDRRNRVIAVVPVAEGAAHAASFPLREILSEVLRRDGDALAIAHQHPGGDPTPSQMDRATTRALAGAAHTVGVRFLDHVVLAGEAWRSAHDPP